MKILKLGQIMFPDNLAKSYIINAPWFFTAAWRVIRLGVARATIEKVTISRGNCRAEIAELLGSEELADQLLLDDK